MSKFIRKFIKTIRDSRKNINLIKIPFEYICLKLKGKNKYNITDYLRGEKEYISSEIPEEFILRIMNAFIKAKNDQKGLPEEYLIGGEWELIIDKIYGTLSQKIYANDINYVSKILSNFAREQISLGLSLSGAITRPFLKKLDNVNKFNKTHPLWKAMTDLSDEVLAYPRNAGNIFGPCLDEKNVVAYTSYRSSYMAQRINDLSELTSSEKKVILEIGGGFGAIPYHLFKHFNSNCTYIDIEIPENCLIISYFLKQCFPEKKILLYGEENINEINIKDYDIVILPNYAIKQIHDLSCELVFNCHSLTEMNPETVKEYIRQTNRICKNYFLHANHEDENFVGKSKKGDIIKHVNLNKEEYELPKNAFKKMYRFPELIHDALTLKINAMCYWEYLYKRIS